MKKQYYAKFREIYNEETKKLSTCYTPVVRINNREVYVTDGDIIMEFENKEDAYNQAKESYFKYIEANT